MNNQINNLDFDFDLLFAKIVEPSIQYIKDHVDAEFKNSFNFACKDIAQIHDSCKRFYEDKNEELKKRFYGSKYNHEKSSKGELCFDLHKMGAIICYSLIKYKVFSFDVKAVRNYINRNSITDTDYIANNVLANYRLAFHVSVLLVYCKMLYDAQKNGDNELYAKLFAQRGLSLYKKSQDHDSFKNSVIMDLAKRDTQGRSFDYFMYSTILFQLEEYNKLLLQEE